MCAPELAAQDKKQETIKIVIFGLYFKTVLRQNEFEGIVLK